jgi:putative cell wall-binding protein
MARSAHRLPRRGVLLVAIALLTSLMASPTTAQSPATLDLVPVVGRPGATIAASGCGYPAGAVVTVEWDDARASLGTATANAQGCFQRNVTVPKTAFAGYYPVYATAESGKIEGYFDDFRVVRPRLTLSVTKGPAGTTTAASGCGWEPGQSVTLKWLATGASLGNVTTGRTGCLPGSNITIPSGAATGWGTIRAEAEVGFRADAAFEVTPKFMWTSAILTSPAVFALAPFVSQNLAVRGVEVTQGIQCYDTSAGLTGCADNSLRLVKDKYVSARIYLRYVNVLQDTRPNTRVRFHVRVKGSGQPFQTVDAWGNATKNLDRLDAATPYVNFKVYGGGGNVTIEYFVTVDPTNVLSESNESDNRFPAGTGYAEAVFRNTAPLRIEGQRIDYHPTGYTSTRTPSGWAVDGGAATWMRQMLPVGDITYTRRSGLLDWTTGLGSGDGQHSLIGTLNGQWLSRQVWTITWNGFFLPTVRVPNPNPDHLYGWAPNAGYSGGHADMPIYPHQNGWGVVGIGTDRVPTNPTTDAPGGGTQIFGHELIHDYDVLHTNTSDSCGSSDGGSDFPYANSSIQEVGFNPYTGKVYDPANTHDVMSYCPSGGSREGWISPFTWEKFHQKLMPRISNGIRILFGESGEDQVADDADPSPRFRMVAAETSESLIVHATVYRELVAGKLGVLGALQRVPTGLDSSGSEVAGEYAIELRQGGTTLRRVEFNRSFESEYGDHHAEDPGEQFQGPNAAATVDLVIPFDAGTTSIVLLKGTTVLDTKTVSANPPTAVFVAPGGGAELVAGTNVLADWTASDPDGGPLYSTLYYRPDPDAPYAQVGILPANVTELSIPVDTLAGGDEATFRVVVSDGVNTVVADSAEFHVPRKAPAVGILTPAAGMRIPQGGSAVLSGFGNDLEDGPLDGPQLAWSSDRDGALGVGGEVTTGALSTGTHVITLRATDSDDVSRTATRTLHVGSVAAPTVRRATGGAVVTTTAELDPVVVATTFTDPSAGGPYTCLVDHGDGTPPVPGAVSGTTCTGPTHTYWLPGQYTVSVQVSDAAGTVGTGGTTHTVTDVAGNDVVRLSGPDRFATAAAISADLFEPGVPEVVIATGTAFPDALTGGPAATARGAPILLAARDSIPDATRAELARLQPKKVTILGGAAAISEAVEAELAAITGVTPTRLRGADRYATAGAIAEASFEPGLDVVTIATGLNFADALSGGPPAALYDGPILLVADSVPEATAAVLTRLKPGRIDVLGGTAAVPDAVVEALKAYTAGPVTRVFGADRFATSAAVSAATYPVEVRTVYVATGLQFADALAGAPSAVHRGAPMLLVTPSGVPESVAAEIRRLTPDRIVILGGLAAVDAATAEQLAGLVGP